ncbi:FtsP/CotA-like multicopper oxidase with cupredoxin domain [Chryseobacterium sp. 16F]|uniref:FtsP/CotA-like multicopper oxidase with cupredoxin domain n=2 Tax=Frigoriflavimonas asaccharolytica TaxID=2735899 RepID=A0A8J8G9T5_9FLAO|nr:multicopper oxidase domain-containing protein [Frigoriflavimonas asaccharolytica]NRS93788.1 FtsP/CotA-like multicopper oxidase with cupredoxin domain [Frigoriflavimonas asaccharolytica]
MRNRVHNLKFYFILFVMVSVQGFAQDHSMHMEKKSETKNDESGKISMGGKTVRYDLYVKDTVVTFNGHTSRAIFTNGKLQAPTLYFTEGDTAEIYLHNQLKKENTGLHWHGVILPNEMDGVPYLTTKEIKPGETHLYKFKISQNGTYWYHSHEGTQEQIGMNGILVFKKRESQPEKIFAADIPVLLGDWAASNPKQIMRRLHMDQTDWYAIKKGTVQSYSEAIGKGYFKTKLLNEWKRMEAMDVSDVYYNNFLINGAISSDYKNLKAGDKVRLRVANGASSSYFWLNYGGGKITVIGSDGNEVEPVEVDRLIVGVSESYDIEVTIPANKSFEFRATSEDRQGFASLYLGDGEKVQAPNLPRLNLFEGMKMMNGMMKMSGDMKPMTMKMGNQVMDMNEVMYPELSESQRMKTMNHMMEMMGDKSDMKMDDEKMQMDHSKMDMKSDMKMKDGKMQMDHSKMDMKSDMKMKDGKMQMDHSKMEMKSDMKMDNGKMEMDHSKMDMGSSEEKTIKRLNYNMLKSPFKTILPTDNVKQLNFTLEGNMRNYLWTLDNKTVAESDKILIKKGQVVRITMYNNSMMRHPMHLHGHDFRIVNAKGEYAPLKNVIDVAPMETVTIEFAANQDGDWFFHCHILYHMMTGMGRVFSYENSAPNPQLPDKEASYKQFLSKNRMVNTTAMLDVSSNSFQFENMTMFGSRWMNINEFRSNYDFSRYEGTVKVGRFLGKYQWAMPYVGFRSAKMDDMKKTLFGQEVMPKNQNVAIAGVRYLLPMLIMADANVDQNGKVILELGRENIPISPRIRGGFMINSDMEYNIGLKYIVQKYVAISTNYDSDYGFGAGLTFMY